MTTAKTESDVTDVTDDEPDTQAPDTPDPGAGAEAVHEGPSAEAAPSGAEVPGGGTGGPADLVRAMDRVSLDQALQDFAVANARVLDLTSRLTSLTEEVARLHDENAQLRIQAARLRELEASGAYQAVRAGRAGVTLLRRSVGRIRRR